MSEPDGSSKAGESPLSPGRLREAFAAMLGQRPAQLEDEVVEADRPTGGGLSAATASVDSCEISPQAIVEALLFVGRPDNKPISAQAIAAVMRDVSPQEVEESIAQLNQAYEEEGAAFHIVASGRSYQLSLREDCSRLRDRFYGRLREAKLSPAAVEVLSIVAYNQPITVESINEIRGVASGGVLATLVRRQLVRLERPPDRSEKPSYQTTDRFLRFMRLGSLDDLPKVEDLDAA